MCGSRKYTHTYPKEGYWNILVGRESQGPKVSKESINQNSNLQRVTGEGGGGQQKTLHGGVWIPAFSGTYPFVSLGHSYEADTVTLPFLVQPQMVLIRQ